MKDKLLIIGASGHGKVVADIAMKMEQWKEIVFLDDDKTIKESLGFRVIGDTSCLNRYLDEYDFFVAIGNNATRERIQGRLEMEGASIAVLIHPNSVIGSQVVVGIGSAIMAGTVINCCTKIGKGCIVNTGASVDHDNWMEDFVHISPGAHLAGTVKIGKRTWIGAGSTVINNIDITGDCIIGAGAIVMKNIVDAGTYIGVPARRV